MKEFHMEQWLSRLPVVHNVFLKIAEPRVTRLIHFAIYLGFMLVGILVLLDPPESFNSILYSPQVLFFSGFLGTGGLLGALAVLPGVWWLERTALLVLGTGLIVYTVVVIGLGSSSIGIGVCVILLLHLLLRYREVKGSQLAPIEG